MNFQEAERAYQDLRAQYSAGKLSNTDFETEVSKLKVQDNEGRWWQIGVQSGDWYMHDGQRWNKAQPPKPATAPSAPPSIPEKPPASTPPAAPTTTAIPKPPRRIGIGLSPRLISAKPAGREGGGLSRPVLFALIGVIAFVVLAIIVAGLVFLSGQLRGGVASATLTPTRAIAALASPSLPTLVPPPPTNTLILVPTLPISPTTVVTPTTAPVTTTTVVRATATRRPAVTNTAAAATPTRAPALPPGVYATKMRVDPSGPTFGQQMRFFVTFVNTSGVSGPSPWFVKIFRCQAACTSDELADNRSIGETPKAGLSAPSGTSELAVGPWSVGLGSCKYIASPYYVDGNGNVVPFPTGAGNRLYFEFKMC